jgi:methionyl-tRNA formyltransferase
MSAPPLRVVFFGTPAFAVPTLEALLASRHIVAAAVTQPDKPRGRGQRTTDGPVKARAQAAGVPVLQPATLKDETFLSAFSELDADIGVVAAYGKILSERLLAIPRLGMINVHASLLPKYRGAAPVHRAVIAGETETGVTIMRVVKALDAGAMLATVHTPVDPHETSEDVERRLAAIGAPLLVETLDRLAAGPIPEHPQDDSQATYAHRLTKDDAAITWGRSAREIHNQIRGLHPWPLAHSFLDGKRLIVRRSDWTSTGTHALPGTVVAAHGDDLGVAAGDGIVRLLQVQAEGKRPASAREFLSGHRVAVGAVFTDAP